MIIRYYLIHAVSILRQEVHYFRFFKENKNKAFFIETAIGNFNYHIL